MTEDTPIKHTTRESADKIRVETQVKRGEGTRDEDRIKIKVRGDEPSDVVEKLNETIEQLHGTADELRGMQPEGQ